MNLSYSNYLKDNTDCPFCGDTNRILYESERCYITYALAPYHKHHLLVVPKKHKESIFKLSNDEKSDIDKILIKSIKILNTLGYFDTAVIVREGPITQNGKVIGKTIRHLHYHVIPNTRIGDVDHKGITRYIMDEKTIDLIKNDIRKALKLL